MVINQKILVAGGYRAIELPADSAIKPGMLIQRTATGVAAQSTAGGFVESMVAFEDALQGRTVDDAYAAGDPVQGGIVKPGALVNALLHAGISYTVGTLLFPTGDGTLRTTTGTPKEAVAVVETALDLSASGSVDTRTLVRFLK